MKSLSLLTLLLCCVPVVLGTSVARAAEGGVFVLPIEGRWPVGDSAAGVFEERLTIAFAEGRKLRAVSSRDVPASKRKQLPERLAACTDAECVRKLADVMGVDRVLSVRLADDDGRVTCFSTVHDARTGNVVQRKEWPGRYGEAGLPRELAGTIARWTVGEAEPRPVPAQAPVLVLKPGILAVGRATGQADTADARALLASLMGRLQGNDGFSVVSEGGPDVSQRAVVAVDHVSVVTRQHHVHHYREGALAATLTIRDVATGAVLLSVRGETKISDEAKHVSEAQVLSTLVSQVVDQWMQAFGAQQISEKLRRKAKP